MLSVEELQTHFSSNRSCILDPVSEAFPCTFLKLSFKFLPCCSNLSLFLSGVAGSPSSDRSSFISKEMTGMGSSRLTKESAVNSSILVLDLDLGRRVWFGGFEFEYMCWNQTSRVRSSWGCRCTAGSSPSRLQQPQVQRCKESE
jgi:hypothetical protein